MSLCQVYKRVDQSSGWTDLGLGSSTAIYDEETERAYLVARTYDMKAIRTQFGPDPSSEVEFLRSEVLADMAYKRERGQLVSLCMLLD